MIHDEETTEIELPVKKTTDNIVRIDFSNGGTERRQAMLASKPVITNEIKKTTQDPLVSQTESLEWFKDYDAETPWMLRLVAVVLVLILSLLIL